MTRILKSSYLLLFFAAFAFVACEKDDVAELGEVVTEEAFTDMERSGQMGCQGCFSIVYPVTLVLPDGSTAEVDGPQAIREAIRAYVQENGRPQTRPEFEYPYDVELEDGTIRTVDSKEAFRELLEECGFEPGGNGPGHGGPFGGNGPGNGGPFGGNVEPCFTLVFPVTVVFEDGSTVEVDSREAIREAIRAYAAENGRPESRPTFEHPYDVELEDGTVQTINSEEDFRALLQECDINPSEGPGIHRPFFLRPNPCYTLVFPVMVDLPVGPNVEAENRQQLLRIMRRWNEQHPNSPRKPRLQLPFEVELSADGSILTVEDFEDLLALTRDCWENFEPCFTMNYPVSIALPDGTTQEADSRQEVRAIFDAWREANPPSAGKPEFVFPLEVTLTEDESALTLEAPEDLRELIEGCRG